MNQNKSQIIQNTMDELSSSLETMISQVMEAKNRKNGMVYSRLSKYIKNELPVIMKRLKI